MMKIIITEKQKILVEDFVDEIDPCFEKTMNFYQSKEGIELMNILRTHLDSKNSDPKYKMDRIIKRRLKNLLKMVPKC